MAVTQFRCRSIWNHFCWTHQTYFKIIHPQKVLLSTYTCSSILNISNLQDTEKERQHYHNGTLLITLLGSNPPQQWIGFSSSPCRECKQAKNKLLYKTANTVFPSRSSPSGHSATWRPPDLEGSFWGSTHLLEWILRISHEIHGPSHSVLWIQ